MSKIYAWEIVKNGIDVVKANKKDFDFPENTWKEMANTLKTSAHICGNGKYCVSKFPYKKREAKILYGEGLTTPEIQEMLKVHQSFGTTPTKQLVNIKNIKKKIDKEEKIKQEERSKRIKDWQKQVGLKEGFKPFHLTLNTENANDEWEKLENHFDYLYNTDNNPEVVYENIIVCNYVLSDGYVAIMGYIKDNGDMKDNLDLANWRVDDAEVEYLDVKGEKGKKENAVTLKVNNEKVDRALCTVISAIIAGEDRKSYDNMRKTFKYEKGKYTAEYTKPILNYKYGKVHILEAERIQNLSQKYIEMLFPTSQIFIKGVKIVEYERPTKDGKSYEEVLLVGIVLSSNEVITYVVKAKENKIVCKGENVSKGLFKEETIDLAEKVKKENSKNEEIYAVDYTFYGEYPQDWEMDIFNDLEDEGYTICFDD